MNTDIVYTEGTVDKFQIITGYPPISPNKCMTCGKYHGTFIDFGFNDDWYGAVYFCIDCIAGMASSLGYCGPSQKKALQESLKIHQTRCIELEKELKRYKDAVDALGAVGIMPNPIDFSAPIDNDAVEKFLAEREELPVTNSKPSGDKQRSIESDDVEGSPSVRDDDSLDQFIDTI